MALPDWLRERAQLVRALYWRPVSRVFLGIYAVLAFVDWAVGAFGSDWLIRQVRLGDRLPDLTIWQWLCLGLGLLFLTGFEASFRLLRTTKAQQPKPQKAVRTVDPAHRDLLQQLALLAEEAEFLMKRRARKGQVEATGFSGEVRAWAAKVSKVLAGFPDWKAQFDSEPAYLSIDDHMGRYGSRDLEHRYEMLGLILQVVNRR